MPELAYSATQPKTKDEWQDWIDLLDELTDLEVQ